MATATPSTSPSGRPPAGLRESASFRTIPGVTVLGPDDLDGLDPARLAASTNERVASGRPPVIQLGHSPERPDLLLEDQLPKIVGEFSNVEVAADGGLTADLHYFPGNWEEALVYAKLSVERIESADPATGPCPVAGPHLAALALLGGPPVKPVGSRGGTRRKAEGPTTGRVCYGAELFAPAVPEIRATGRIDPADVATSYRIARDLGIDPVTCYARLIAGRLRDRAGRAYYAQDRPPTGALAGGLDARPGLVDFATKHGITSLPEARRRYDEARARGRL